MLLPGFVACRPVCTARRAQGCVSGAKAAPQGSGCCWWHSKAFLLPTSPHLGMQDEDAPSLPPSSVSVLVSLPPPALSISPPQPSSAVFPSALGREWVQKQPLQQGKPRQHGVGKRCTQIPGVCGLRLWDGHGHHRAKKNAAGAAPSGSFPISPGLSGE